MMDCYDPENVANIVQHVLDGSFVKDNVVRGVTLSDNYALILAQHIRNEQLAEPESDNPVSEHRQLIRDLVKLRGAATGGDKRTLRHAIRRIERLESTLLEIRDMAQQVE